MVFEAKNELKEYLTSINPIYARYTECLWANEVNCVAQLGNASLPVMHALGVESPIHAGDIIAQSKATGKWSCYHCSVTPVHCLASQRSCATTVLCSSSSRPSNLIEKLLFAPQEYCQHAYMLKRVH